MMGGRVRESAGSRLDEGNRSSSGRAAMRGVCQRQRKWRGVERGGGNDVGHGKETLSERQMLVPPKVPTARNRTGGGEMDGRREGVTV